MARCVRDCAHQALNQALNPRPSTHDYAHLSPQVEGHDKLVASHPGKAASDLYGGEHLLRLIVTLPALLNKAEMTPRNLAALQPRLQELLRFMEKGFVTYFLSESQYIRCEGGDDGGADAAGGGKGTDGEGAGGAGGGQ